MERDDKGFISLSLMKLRLVGKLERVWADLCVCVWMRLFFEKQKVRGCERRWERINRSKLLGRRGTDSKRSETLRWVCVRVRVKQRERRKVRRWERKGWQSSIVSSVWCCCWSVCVFVCTKHPRSVFRLVSDSTGEFIISLWKCLCQNCN